MVDFIASNDSQLLDAYSSAVSGVIKRTSQAVVHIRATGMKHVQAGENQPDQTASGPGFVISSDYYIITNHNVIEDAEAVVVTFYDGLELNTTVTGSDNTVWQGKESTTGTCCPHC